MPKGFKATRILDLGCGTGRSLSLITRSHRARCFGLDLSMGMLLKARQFDPAYHLVRASAPYPPCGDESFDLIICVHVFHHLQASGSYLYKYFDGTFQTDLERFPSKSEMASLLETAGFADVDDPVVEHIQEEKTDEDIFDSYFIQKQSSSQLILLSDEAYAEGVNRMKEEIKRARETGQRVTFHTDLRNRMYHGFKTTERP